MEGFDIERLEERQYDSLGVIYRKEIWTIHTDRQHPITMESGYSSDGGYIGTWEYTQKLVSRGIYPERRSTSHTHCSIGFCPREEKWYGWSHRAIYGFAIGDVVHEDDCTASSGWTDEYLMEHPEADISLPIGFVAKSLDDAALHQKAYFPTDCSARCDSAPKVLL